MSYTKFQNNKIELLLIQKYYRFDAYTYKKKLSICGQKILYYLYSQKKEMCQLQKITSYIYY